MNIPPISIFGLELRSAQATFFIAFILVVLLFLPRGISGIIDIIRELLHRRKGANHADAA